MREGVCLTSKLPIERGPIESDTGVTPLYSIPWSRFVERGEIKGFAQETGLQKVSIHIRFDEAVDIRFKRGLPRSTAGPSRDTFVHP